MPDFNPMLLRHMLALRQFPMFATAELAELATVAENVVETSFRAGEVVASAAAMLPGLHLVLDGRIDAGRAWGARDIFGALEVLAGRRAVTAGVAAIETHTLHLSATDLFEVLEDNAGVLRSVVRELAARMLAAAPTTVAPPPPPCLGGPLGLVERLIVLRQQVPFVGARLQGLAALAHASDEVSWPAGTVVVRAGEPAPGSSLVIAGRLRERWDDGTSRELGAGHMIGGLETLAGIGHAGTIETTTPVRALATSATTILDVLEDHPDVGVSMLSAFARALLDSPARARVGL